MPDEKITREKIVELFDEVEKTEVAFIEAKARASFARSREADARENYERAVKAWNEATEKISKEITK